MNLRGLFLAALASLAVVDAEVVVIGHDKVQPFAQLIPTTDSEKTAIKFKPQLRISNGCHPYPAVDSKGSVSGGLKWSGWSGGGCKGSDLGSQIYSRSDWYNGKWAIMYAWYFPKGKEPSDMNKKRGHRHYWSYGIVWTDSPSPDTSIFLGVSMRDVYYVENPPPENRYVLETIKFHSYTPFLDGNTVTFDSYVPFLEETQILRLTKRTGKTQDLITWEQMSEEARDALLETDFNVDRAPHLVMPLGDNEFKGILEGFYPF